MLFQCWVNKKTEDEPMKYEFMFTEDGFCFDKIAGDSVVINQEFEGFNEEIDEEE